MVDWADATDETMKQFTREFKMIGASRAYTDLVKSLLAAVRICDASGPQVVFLHSEPGCGKENMAKLIHLMSPRSTSARLTYHFAETLPAAAKADQSVLKSALQNLTCECDPTTRVADIVLARRRRYSLSPKWATTRLFNYFSLNMATLHSHALFTEGLFGDYGESLRGRQSGRCLLAHLLHGTVFLDEFNTLQEPRWANCFLRLLEEPCELEIHGRPAGPIVNANFLMICASNLAGEELIRRGFSEAVVYRLTRRSFAIPPLRDRKVDIAVFVNASLRKHNSSVDAPASRIRRVNNHAMRLLCELPWPDNYRGIQGLLSVILEARVRRGTTQQALSFEDVVEGLRRRETLLAAARRPAGDAQPAAVTVRLVH
jgi:DNA-binding NtrC family response regulator